MAKRRSSETAMIAAAAFLLGMLAGAFLLQARDAALPEPASLGSGSKVVIGVPAVGSSGEGIIGTLTTEVKPGNGQILVDVKDVVAFGDTQQSAQKAVIAASALTRKSLESVDVVLKIDVNATSIEGSSAGAAMAVSIVFGLNNETPRSGVTITGTIEQDGRIGRVGSVLEKARAAKAAGIGTILVPPGQAADRETQRTRQCRTAGTTQHCRIIYQSATVNIAERLNMTVIEVGTLKDAVKHFAG